jgi:hypothetical protein
MAINLPKTVLIHEALSSGLLTKAPLTHASQHYTGGADPITPANIDAEPELGTIGTAGVYGINETSLGLHSIAPIGRANVVKINRLINTIQTDTYTVEDTDEVIVCDKTTAMFIYVPETSGTGQRLYIKNINTGIVTVDCSATELIDNVETIELNQWDCLELVSYDTGKWAII